MRRREFVAKLTGAAAWPKLLNAEESSVVRIGLLSTGLFDDWTERRQQQAFRLALSEIGLKDGQNILITHLRSGREDSQSDLELLLSVANVKALVVMGARTALTAKRATTTIPIIFLMADNPVEFGLIVSFGRPGGNVTGLTNNLNAEFGPKRLEPSGWSNG
jgi:putative ABC transport system substrate-binding protein